MAIASAIDLAQGNAALAGAIQHSRKLLHRRALVAAAASAVPVPGLDWAVDAALLSRLIPQINLAFGLTPQQLDHLTPHKREQVQKAVAMVGSVLVGKFITRDLVLRAAKTVGLRLTAKQAARYVPLAGQAASALIGYSAIRYLGEQHIKDCVAVARQAGLALPAPQEKRT
ncbi:MAG: hypothetical protein IPK34_02870 [Ramlibacter sp.]|jgi:uncharacterized protein (DUF697 family)|nr:hypothetical protein [Ramlibacter sp.]